MPADGFFPFLMPDIVESNRRWNPDSPALIFGERTHSWAEFAATVEEIQQGLAAQGVGRGSRVAVLDRNSDDYVLLHYALAGMGAVLSPVNMWLRAHEIAYILSVSQPLLLVTSDEFRDLADAAVEPLAEKPRLVVRGARTEGAMAWREMRGARTSRPIPRPRDWDDPHLVLYTSGTTGRPKGALISHRRTILDGLSAIGALGIRRRERFFCYMPLFHTGGWDFIKLYFMQGGSAVIVDRFEPESAVQAISRHRCTGMFGVPVVMRQLMEAPSWPAADMSAMRLITYANYDPSNLILDVAAAFRDRGAAGIGIANTYGLTEGGPFITILRPEDADARPQKIGTPVPGAQVALLDEEGREVPRGAIGEICIRSAALMSGYLNRPEATEETFAGGWMHTGDLGQVDEEGFLAIVDRKKAMIRTGGENVYAKEVEQVLVEHPAVLDCAVIGLPDDDYGERVVGVIQLHPHQELDASALIAWTREHIAGFKTPRQVIFVDGLPKTPAGKIMKHVLVKELKERAGGGG